MKLQDEEIYINTEINKVNKNAQLDAEHPTINEYLEIVKLRKDIINELNKIRDKDDNNVIPSHEYTNFINYFQKIQYKKNKLIK